MGGGPRSTSTTTDGGSDTQAGLNFVLGVAHRGGFFVEAKVGAFDSPNLKFGFGYSF